MKFRRIILTIPLLFLGLISMANSAGAVCCGCLGKDSSTICINTEQSDCSTLSIKSKNIFVNKLTCANSIPDCKTVASGGSCSGGVFDEATYSTEPAQAVEVKTFVMEAPQLGIPIPGIEFTKQIFDEAGRFKVPFIAQYISGVYRYLVGISAIAAAIMITYGGFLYIFAQTGIKVRQGKTIITEAVVGLVLIMGAYTILNAVNPSLVAWNPLEVPVVRPADEEAIATYGSAVAGESEKVAERVKILPRPETPGPVPGTPAPGAPLPTPTPSTPTPTPGEQPKAPVFVENISPSDLVDISAIKVEKELGGPKNLQKFCASIKEGKEATTAEAKRKLLARAVLGWHKVCTVNQLCAYCQTCSTNIPDGKISGSGFLFGFALDTLVPLIVTPEEMFPDQTCRDVYQQKGDYAKEKNPKAKLQTMPACARQPYDFYQSKILNVLQENKYWGGDCIGFSRVGLPTCAGISNVAGIRINYTNKKGVKTTGFAADATQAEQMLEDPRVIVFAPLNADLMAEASKKGGLKFGDIGAIVGRYPAMANHYFMYTGGRPDVPFTFIEMGGQGGPSIPVPGTKGLSGIGVKVGWDLNDYAKQKTAPTKMWSACKKNCKDVWIPSKTDPNNTFMFIWRTIPDDE